MLLMSAVVLPKFCCMCASSNALRHTVLMSPYACCAGDTSSSSGYEEIEAIPTAQGLRFGDLPSPSGSEFGTPRASVAPDSQMASLSQQPGSSREESDFLPRQMRGPQVC